MRFLRSSVVARVLTAAVCCLLLLGCSHYKVTDTSTGNVYFTERKPSKKFGGAIEFVDGRTAAEVTLQSHAVEQISKREYKVGIYTESESDSP
jgi:hypothetical protein